MTPTPGDYATAYLILGTAGCMLLAALGILTAAAANATRRTRQDRR